MKTIYLSIAALTLAACTSKAVVGPPPSPIMTETIIVDSQNDFSTSDNQLKTAITKRDLKLFAVINHGEGALSAAMPIGRSKLYIFGNPKSGTPLMMDKKIVGLELPMKILIYEDDGVVKVGRKDMTALMVAYEADVDRAVLNTISNTLEMVVYEASHKKGTP